MEPDFSNRTYHGRATPSDTMQAERFDRLKAEKIYREQVGPRLIKIFEKKKSKYKIKCEGLVKVAEEDGVKVDNIFEDTYIKTEHLKRIMGYRTLRGPENEAIAIDGAKPERIGEVYRNCYRDGRK